ncbi:MAG: hypothetical protein WC686_04570 [Candidatus Shapirobacteria bacterium]|jgi:hypothetical protein
MAELKEKLPGTVTEGKPNEIKFEDLELGKEAPLPREVETWMTKVEKTATSTVTDSQGQTVMQPSTPPPTTTALPISRQTFVAGFKKKLEEAGRWLSEYIFRLIKIKKGQVKFKQNE